MRPKAIVLALISVIPKLLCAVYQQLILPNALSWPAPSRSGSMGPFPASIMVKIKPTGPQSSSWACQDTNQGQHKNDFFLFYDIIFKPIYFIYLADNLFVFSLCFLLLLILFFFFLFSSPLFSSVSSSSSCTNRYQRIKSKEVNKCRH